MARAPVLGKRSCCQFSSAKSVRNGGGVPPGSPPPSSGSVQGVSSLEHRAGQRRAGGVPMKNRGTRAKVQSLRLGDELVATVLATKARGRESGSPELM